MICQDIAVRNRKLIRYFVLAHQYTGDKYVDFGFPPDQGGVDELASLEGYRERRHTGTDTC